MQERPVFRNLTNDGHYGPTVFMQSYLDDEGLALMRADALFTAERQKELELNFDMNKVKKKEN